MTLKLYPGVSIRTIEYDYDSGKALQESGGLSGLGDFEPLFQYIEGGSLCPRAVHIAAPVVILPAYAFRCVFFTDLKLQTAFFRPTKAV